MANPKIRGRARQRKQECRHCGHHFPIDLLQCTSCRQWNFKEQLGDDDGTSTLADVADRPLQTIQTGPWDICFCNQSNTEPGLVETSVTVIGGYPGSGKSTMSLQLGACLARSRNREVMYVAAEEAKEEIRARAVRLEINVLNLIRVYPMGATTDLGDVLDRRKPAAIVIDSVSGMTEDPAEQAQICKNVKGYAVSLKAPVIVICHVNKGGDFAGLMALQHHVDTLLILSPHQIGDNKNVRTLESVKNRNGALAQVMLEMTEKGLIEYHLEDES